MKLLLQFLGLTKSKVDTPKVVDEVPFQKSATPPFEVAMVRLLQHENRVSALTTPSELAKTTQTMITITRQWASSLPAGQDANTCIIFAAVRPARRMKTWTICSGNSAPHTPLELDERIAEEFDAEQISDVTGLVLFSIHGRAATNGIPEEWKRVAEDLGRAVEVERIVDHIWPETLQ